MTTIAITIEIDPLTREVWTFRAGFYTGGCEIYLESFARDSRASARHRKWDRSRTGTWERKNARDSTCERPEVSPEIAAEVRARLCEMVKGAEVR